jgi:hypothetical protein
MTSGYPKADPGKKFGISRKSVRDIPERIRDSFGINSGSRALSPLDFGITNFLTSFFSAAKIQQRVAPGERLR